MNYTNVASFSGGAVVGVCAAVVAYFVSIERTKSKEKEKLGPRDTDARYGLSLVGKVDTLYENFGPKPFEFNRDVVNVFDDMVSRSVPLYREVNDILLYWVHRYYRPGKKLYDLGCSTGTTLDLILKSLENVDLNAELVGIDNSQAMVEKCREKLSWAPERHTVDIQEGDITACDMTNACFVIMNYTLQFIPVTRRIDVLRGIFNGLCEGGILFISEKIRFDDSEFQEACTWIYEDFKSRRGYTKTYIARKKEALMNVLVPYTEQGLKNTLELAGFNQVEVTVKWNNFVTITARKGGLVPVKGTPASSVSTPHLDSFFNYNPTYLSEYLRKDQLEALCLERSKIFAAKGGLGTQKLLDMDKLCEKIQQLPELCSNRVFSEEGVAVIGDKDEFSEDQFSLFKDCVEEMMPWKKGPFDLFGIQIDSEWRSDWKWERLLSHLPSLKDKVVCDLGCANGYYMYRMLDHDPKLVVGIDPNLKAWLQFQAIQRFSGRKQLQFEYLRGEHMDMFPEMYDVVFCLGVLYHTPDPIGMLRKIHKSMKSGAYLFVDCQGIPGDDHVALFPQKRYANMKGVYFLPTIQTLKNWLSRTRFNRMEIFFSEPLSTEEQRITEWAQVNTSLNESLDANDKSKTIEGYPAPHRFYLRARRG